MVLGLQKSCKTQYRKYSYACLPVSPIVASYITVIHLSRLRSNLYILSTKLHTLFRFFLSFSFSVFFSIQGSNPGYHMTFSHHVSVFSDLWRSFRLSLFFHDLDSFRSVGQVFCRMSLNLDLSDALLMVRLGVWVLERKTPEVKCPHHIISRVHAISISHHWWS